MFVKKCCQLVNIEIKHLRTKSARLSEVRAEMLVLTLPRIGPAVLQSIIFCFNGHVSRFGTRIWPA